MSKFSDFDLNKKTRNEIELEKSLKNMKNYKTSQNLDNLNGIYFDDNNFFDLGKNKDVIDNDMPMTVFNDPRYKQSNTRDQSRKQINNIKNLQSNSNLKVKGFEYDDNYEEFNETNYENPGFIELNRDLKINTNPKLKGGYISDELINVKKNKTEDINNLFTNKKININNLKGKIIHFKNCDEKLQNVICTALINEWPEDFSLKKITSSIGVKNFILFNFKDKLNSFFVFLDQDNDFLSTFAIDTENFAPYISHLFVNPNNRNNGIGKKTLKYAEKYIKKLGFNNSNLWCEEGLINYYKKNGYNIDEPLKISENRTVWKMNKNLN